MYTDSQITQEQYNSLRVAIIVIGIASGLTFVLLIVSVVYLSTSKAVITRF